jgi:hypothetical protein
MKVETFADQLFFATVHLSGADWVATGFVYAVETDQGAAHFLLTNKHVLEGVTDFNVRMIAGDGSLPALQPVLGTGITIEVNGLNAEAWVGHPNPNVDVAAMPMSAVLKKMAEVRAAPFFRSVSSDLCVTADVASELDSLEDVVFVGYPSGIFDEVNLLPVARRGTTATPVAVDYRGLPAFLIDASVFPGSSGSPVFLAPSGVTMVRGQGVVVGHQRPPCLGVLAAVHVRQLEGELAELPTRLGVSFAEPVDLGIVFKASTFEECVEPMLQAAGLERVETAAPEAAEGPSDADAKIAEEVPTDGGRS